MKFGIKIWSTNTELVKQARKHFEKGDFDFIEISAIIGSYDEELLSQIKGIPTVVHLDNNKVNFADPEDEKNNIAAIREGQMFADFLEAEHIIIHPGYSTEDKYAKEFISRFKDERFCLENMPGKTMHLNEFCLGRTVEELKLFNIKKYCLDIAHAIKAAKTLNINFIDLIKSLSELNPVIIHASDGVIDSEVDEHLNIGEGQFNFKQLFRIIPNKENIMVSLETPKKDYESLDGDIKNIKKLKEIIN